MILDWDFGKRVWEQGKLEGDLRILWRACFCLEVEVTCPNPSLGLEGSGDLPRSPDPYLLGSPGSARRGEQILQASLILHPIPENVHGDTLKPSELI